MEKVIVILGPTAVGKTKMSVELAKKLNGEIINADSTQIYRGLDIATAKITEEEKEGIEHHLFDIRDYTEDYTVYDYQKDCRRLIADIIQRGKTPILCASLKPRTVRLIEKDGKGKKSPAERIQPCLSVE